MKTVERIITAIGLIAALCIPGFATPIEIADFNDAHRFLTFGELPDRTVVDNEYAALGVTFSATRNYDGFGAAAAAKVIALIEGYPLPNFLGLIDYSWHGSIILDFDSTIFVTQVGGMLLGSDSWLSVYDSLNNLIETVPWQEGDENGYDFTGITYAGGIRRAIFSGNFYAVDDVRFYGTRTSVPEPSILCLLGFGLLVVPSLYCHRSKK